MSTYPTTPRVEFVEWCDVHTQVFTKNAATLGLSAAQVAGFDEATAKARSALLEQEQARQALLVATQRARDYVQTLRERAGSTVRTIRAHAETTDDPSALYALAQIAPLAAHSPAPPPSQPKQLGATLIETTGALTLRWKARQPTGTTGTTYLIRRRLPAEAAFSFVGVAGKKTFVDETLPSALTHVQYTVQAQRGTRSGPVSAILEVNFGQRDGAGATRSLQSATGDSATLVAGGRVAEAVRC